MNLENKLTLDVATIRSPNLTDQFTDNDLALIGHHCKMGYEQDLASRSDWMRRNEAGMDLALQIQKDKSFPWAGCANVAFPIVTIAALQFHAQAYPAIVDGNQVVKCETFGSQDEKVVARAERVSTHMSWQVLYQDRSWEDQADKGLFNLSIVGCNFKKTRFVGAKAHNVSELVLAKNFVINYYAKSLEECPRKTHQIPLFRNEVRESVLSGTYRDILDDAWYLGAPAPRSSRQQAEQDNRQGTTPPPPSHTDALPFCEQHINLDLDQDGYDEPYIITFHETTGTVVRIVTRFDSDKDIERATGGKYKGKILRIKATEYFTKYGFIPSPDGGFYDIGFGVFLGPLNETINSLVNVLLDSGTMQVTAGGFLGRGAKIRGGQQTHAPFEWKRVDATGDDLRKSLVPLPVNAPSDVLYQLLGLLINYASRISGTTDTVVGENPGQNTPASTTQTMVQMGQKVYSAIFKRVWRAAKEEFRKLYLLNSIYLPLDRTFPGGATRADYTSEGDEICPVADPNITSDSQKLQIAIAVKTASATTPGYNKDAVEKLFLKSLHVDNIAGIFPGGQPPPEDPKLAIAKLQEENETQRLQMQLESDQQQFILATMAEQQLNNAKIVELEAKAAEAAANAQSEMAYAQVALINAEVAHVKNRNDALNKRIEHILRIAELRSSHHLGLKQIEKKAA